MGTCALLERAHENSRICEYLLQLAMKRGEHVVDKCNTLIPKLHIMKSKPIHNVHEVQYCTSKIALKQDMRRNIKGNIKCNFYNYL
jgi:hypothetical protein